MAYVGMVCNPCPDWPWPDEKPQSTPARYLSGLYPGGLHALAAPARRACGYGRADRWIGLSDGGSGLEARLQENFPRVELIILDFYHPAEKLTGFVRWLYLEDEEHAEDQARQWCARLKDEGVRCWQRSCANGIGPVGPA